MDESLWLLGLLSAALPIVATVASRIGYSVGSRYWQAKLQAAHRYEVEAEERAFQAEEASRIMRIAQDSSIALAYDKLRLWRHVKRLWDERDAAIRWADAWKATCADIDAERLAALARCADLEREISRLQAVVCEEDYKSIGRVLSGPSTVAAEAKAFIEQASAEVQEEAARLAAIDWERVERALNESREITAKLSDLRKIDPDVCNRPMDI